MVDLAVGQWTAAAGKLSLDNRFSSYYSRKTILIHVLTIYRPAGRIRPVKFQQKVKLLLIPRYLLTAGRSSS